MVPWFSSVEISFLHKRKSHHLVASMIKILEKGENRCHSNFESHHKRFKIWHMNMYKYFTKIYQTQTLSTPHIHMKDGQKKTNTQTSTSYYVQTFTSSSLCTYSYTRWYDYNQLWVLKELSFKGATRTLNMQLSNFE